MTCIVCVCQVFLCDMYVCMWIHTQDRHRLCMSYTTHTKTLNTQTVHTENTWIYNLQRFTCRNCAYQTLHICADYTYHTPRSTKMRLPRSEPISPENSPSLKLKSKWPFPSASIRSKIVSICCTKATGYPWSDMCVYRMRWEGGERFQQMLHVKSGAESKRDEWVKHTATHAKNCNILHHTFPATSIVTSDWDESTIRHAVSHHTQREHDTHSTTLQKKEGGMCHQCCGLVLD